MREQIILGKWTEEKIDHLLIESSKISDPGKRIDFISKHFLDTRYKESTLIGDIKTPEVFVINLEDVDCFTFLDYVEAMRISRFFVEFKKNLKRTRYQSGRIAFKYRNHFFTDWMEFNKDLIEDITVDTGIGKSKKVKKRLNEKDNGRYFLPGIPCREREIVYIPSEVIKDAINEKLQTGYYVGIYSEKTGLDVSHVGIIIKEGDTVNLRHASSVKNNRKVIDENFKKYILNKPGFIVLRPRDLLS